jgi:hypothetical protein
LPEGQAGTQNTGRSEAREKPRSLAALFHRSPRPAQPADELPPISTRRRASTSVSREPRDRRMSIVQQFCTQPRPVGDNSRPRADSRAFEPLTGGGLPAAGSGSVVNHGQEGVPVDMIMDSTDARGVVGSALSLHSGNLPPASLLTEPDTNGAHHHDDVVEHLSVIGELSFINVQFCSEADDEAHCFASLYRQPHFDSFQSFQCLQLDHHSQPSYL